MSATGWREESLCSMAELIKDAVQPTNTETTNYIGLEHIAQEKLRLISIGSSTDVTSTKYVFKPNDILFGKLRPYFRKVIHAKFSGVCSTDIFVVRALSGTNASFLFYFLSNWQFVDLASGDDGGTHMPRADWNFLRNTKCIIPREEEQKAIAAVLSSLDDKIYLLHRQNATLEGMAEALFRQWFVVEAKEEWEEVAITKLFEVRDGTHDSPKEVAYGKKLVTSKHIHNGRLDLGSAYYISNDDFEAINKRSAVQKGDILYSMIGTLGLVYLESSQDINYAIKNIGLFKTSQNAEWLYYTYLWLKSSLGKEFIEENRSGSTQEYIPLGGLRSIAFKVPPQQMLNSFNAIVSPFFDKFFQNQTQILILEKLRDTLLPKLMSGEVRVEV